MDYTGSENQKGAKMTATPEIIDAAPDTEPGRDAQAAAQLAARRHANIAALSTGTVTMLLADVEGSTRLWETQPAEMTAAVARLDRAGVGGRRHSPWCAAGRTR